MIKLILVLILIGLFIIAEVQEDKILKKNKENVRRPSYTEKKYIKKVLNTEDYVIDRKDGNSYELMILHNERKLYFADIIVKTSLKFNGKNIKLDLFNDLEEGKKLEVIVKKPYKKPKIYLNGIKNDEGDHYGT